ncbi:MAG: dynamin family protein [Acidimicrobiales bacterium]
MTSELDELTATARELAATEEPAGDIATRARRLGDRLAQRRFHVTVLGEFKRGKSTLVNALLAEDILPTGALPLTAVATEISFGERRAVVEHLDGRRYEIAPDELAEYVTEERNPANERSVARVEVQVPARLLEPGLVLVDTPGLGSIYRHNDEEARRALFDADGAILVLSADSPLSAREQELLGVLAERRAPTFFVLNKIDHLATRERDQVRRFVSDAVAAELGRNEQLWCLSARAALARGEVGRVRDGREGDDFAAFEAAFEEFVRNDLVEARLVSARRELARLGRALEDAVSLEMVGLALESAELGRRVTEFETEAAGQRQAFEDERTLLARDVAVLMAGLAERLFDFARTAPARHTQELESVAETVPVGRLQDALQSTVEKAVQEGFEEFRRAEADRVEQAWTTLAERFRSRTEERVNRVRQAAADLFTISLPAVAVPAVAAERERFFYLFLKIEPSGEDLLRAGRRLLPPSLVRRRLLARACAELTREFDKHAGRARWDLTQRLDSVRRQFEAAMGEELDGAINAIKAAAARAEELRQANESERDHRLAAAQVARQAALHALSFGETGQFGTDV